MEHHICDTRTTKLGTLSALVALVLITTADNARAQSVDYGSLESLFGEPVTTSVTGSPQRASDVPATMSIITQDEIRRSGAGGIPGVLRHVPGIDVSQWANNDASVSARGYNEPMAWHLLVLLNGRPVDDDRAGYTKWSTIPVELSDIRQIEIVKGPAAALFGFNAVGGVVNIITYDPLYDDVNTASIAGGTQKLVRGSAVATYRIADVGGLRISLGKSSSDDFSTTQLPENVGSRQGDRRLAIDISSHMRLGEQADVAVELSHSEIGESSFRTPHKATFFSYLVNSARAQFNLDTDLGLISVSAYGSGMNSRDAGGGGQASNNFKNSVAEARIQDIFKLSPEHTFRLSAEYRYNEAGTGPVTGGKIFYDISSGGAMWQWNATPSLSITNAVRLDFLQFGRSGTIPDGLLLTNDDWNRRTISQPSFNSGIVWRADDTDTFRLLASEGAELPNLSNSGAFLLRRAPGRYLGGIPTLKPRVVSNYELGWDKALPSFGGQFRASAFYERTRDIMSFYGGRLPALGLDATPTNIGSSEAIGLELSLNGTFSKSWRWGLSYTPEIITDHFASPFNVPTFDVSYQSRHPVHVVNANLGWTNGPWEADAYLRYESSFRGVQNVNFVGFGTLVRIPNYVSMDARFAYRVNDNLTLALSGQNLLQSPQKQTSTAEVERRINFTATVGF